MLGIFLILNNTAAALDVFKLTEVSTDGRFYLGHTRHADSAAPPKHGINFNINMDVLEYGYWNNTIHSLADEKKFVMVGWEYKAGVRVTKWLDVEYRHFSKHSLDQAGPWQFHFPVEDSIGFKVHFLNTAPRSPNIMDAIWKK